MHPKSIIPYMQPMFHQKKIAAIVPLGLGLELCPSAMAKVQGSWRGGPAEPGHLPRSRQACLKGMVKWYWYLPIRNSLSYFSLTLSLSPLWPLLPCIIHENMLLTDISLFCLQLLTTQNSKESNLSRIYHACISKLSLARMMLVWFARYTTLHSLFEPRMHIYTNNNTP
jgi:hypothetical protein